MDMKTAIVILNWNGREFLERFLPGLVASCTEDSEVIVADNASTDGSMDMLTERFPEVRTMVFSKNWGFTGGYNRALMQLDAEYFVLINSDIEVPDNWLSPLVQWMDSHPDCGICAPKLHSYDNKDMFEYAGAAGGYIDSMGYPFCRGRIMKMLQKDNGQYDIPAEVFWATGACLMIRSSLYKALGGLDERFFAHMEEIDLCWRAQLEGWKIWIVPDSTVYHVGGGTLPNNSPWKLYLNFRNNLLMLENNLAKTLGLKLLRQGNDIRTSERMACKLAKRKITLRMFLDGISAAVYLITLRTDYFKAVIKAHKDYRRLVRKKASDTEPVSKYLKRMRKKADITGIWNGLIIPLALLRGKKAFNIFR